MAYYDTCPFCGANLDPGERCDCMSEPQSADESGTAEEHKESLKRGNA